MIDVLGPEKRRRRTTQEKIAIVQQSFVSRMVASHLLLSRKRVSPSFTSPDIGHVTILDLAVSQLSALQVLRIATSS